MILAWVFLTVSIVAAAMQAMALARLTRDPDRGLVAGGLRRTGVCRVVAAFAYVALAVMSLLNLGGSGVLAVATFSAVQAMWITNGLLDVRLRRRLGSVAPIGRHRRRDCAPT